MLCIDIWPKGVQVDDIWSGRLSSDDVIEWFTALAALSLKPTMRLDV